MAAVVITAFGDLTFCDYIGEKRVVRDGDRSLFLLLYFFFQGGYVALLSLSAAWIALGRGAITVRFVAATAFCITLGEILIWKHSVMFPHTPHFSTLFLSIGFTWLSAAGLLTLRWMLRWSGFSLPKDLRTPCISQTSSRFRKRVFVVAVVFAFATAAFLLLNNWELAVSELKGGWGTLTLYAILASVGTVPIVFVTTCVVLSRTTPSRVAGGLAAIVTTAAVPLVPMIVIGGPSRWSLAVACAIPMFGFLTVICGALALLRIAGFEIGKFEGNLGS
ncbi:MAG: hypothetical protein KJ000_18575 [Pirellulaceae bacterium]|nr:hypothetical protein [Pirellulaceae bacterium]